MIRTAKNSASGYVIKAVLYVLALIAAVTGTMAIAVGTRVVPAAGIVSPSLDNEFRFFSVFWLAYGIGCFTTARQLHNRLDRVPWLALVMLTAGLARMASVVLVGMPGNQYFYGAIVEVVFAAMLYAAYRKLR